MGAEYNCLLKMADRLSDMQQKLGVDEIAAALLNKTNIYKDDGAVKPAFLAQISDALEAQNAQRVQELVLPLHESEVADVLEDLKPEQRPSLVSLLGEGFDYAALTELDDGVRRDILEELPNAQLAGAVQDLESDDAVFILEDLQANDREEILAQLSFADQAKLRKSLDYPDETAGRRMQTEFIAAPPFWTVGQTIDYMRETQQLPEDFNQIFVVDPSFKLLGAVGLDRILRARREVRIEEVMHESRYAIPAMTDQEEAARTFEQYDLLSAAVVDEHDKLVGVLTIDDVVDVIQQEAEEDIKRLAGVGDEELSDNVLRTTRLRFVWLMLNLCTAILASIVIGMFDATIEQMVALAVLMPIVASMGGNAGTQTMTVAVRAIATRDLDSGNAKRITMRELSVGAVNGLLFAVIMAVVAYIWFGSGLLGAVIALAMIVNMVCASLAGILIPLAIDRFGQDPAIASSVFVTTVTDIIGFFVFLGLAAWVLV